jgi:hypothetical protein
MTRSAFPFLGVANFLMAATPLLALVVAYAIPATR